MNKPVRYVIRFFRSAFYYCILDPMAIALVGRKAPTAHPAVALLYLHGMGDLLLSLHALGALRDSYKARGFSVFLYVDEHATQLAQAVDGIDGVISIDKNAFMRAPVYRWRCLQDFARAGYRAAVQSTYNRFLIVEDTFMRAVKGHERIGSSGSPMFISRLERFLGDRWYTRLTPCAPQALHEIDRNNEFLRALGLSANPAWPELPSSLSALSSTPQSGIILISMKASHPLKSWPVRRFEKLAHFLARKTGRRLVFVGAANEIKPEKSFHRWNDKHFMDHVGKTNLASLVEWIARSNLIIANDSVVMHLAALMRRPVVTIAGGGIPARYHPYPASRESAAQPVIVDEPMPCFGCGWRCRYTSDYSKPAPCILGVPTTRVARAVLRALAVNTDNAGRPH